MKMYVIQINNGFVINLDVNAKNWIIGALAKDEYMWNPSAYELFEQAKKLSKPNNSYIFNLLYFYSISRKRNQFFSYPLNLASTKR